MAKIIGPALPNIPWQEKPAQCGAPVWRYTDNPVITRHAVPAGNSVFNSSPVPFGDGFAGVFRCDDRSMTMNIHAGFSKDGYHWTINPEPIVFEGDPEVTAFEYRYDCRVCHFPEDDRYYLTWCNGYHGPTIGVAWTKDFQSFHQIENAFLPYNRNGVLFPRRIGGEYAMLSRPSDTGHTPFGDTFVSFSKDMIYWGKHRFAFGPCYGWESKKVGPGPTPVETDEGWLLIYHGVLNSCNGFVYRMGVMLLDLEKPWQVIERCAWYILGPEEIYELAGDVPNVTFPCAALTDAPTGRIAIYYGCADTVTGLAFTTVDELLAYMRSHPNTRAQR